MLRLRYNSESLTLAQINELPSLEASLLCFRPIALQNFTELLTCGSNSQCIFDCELKLICKLYVYMDVSLVPIV
jgi:hypothetical protein